MMLGDLADHSSTVTVVLETRPCVRFVSLLQDENPEVADGAGRALYWISQLLEGAQAALDTDALQMLGYLLTHERAAVASSETPSLQLVYLLWWVRIFVSATAISRSSTVAASALLEIALQLVSRLRNIKLEVVESAPAALLAITQWPDEAQAAMDAHVAEYLPELLKKLASYETTVSARRHNLVNRWKDCRYADVGPSGVVA
ncbi:hypothetical protein DFH09DRAFT_1475491 [Mycena vulgaris]|nr:hypothetical protein DFH09DRAFT_1475491 [Mycena vulgaris]